MAYKNLPEFIQALESKGWLKRIKAEVDPALEITEIVTRVVKAEGPALLFENVKGSPFPLVINLYGHMDRITLALGKKPSELGAELAQAAHDLQPPTPKAFWENRKTIWRGLQMRFQKTSTARAQQFVVDPMMNKLPVLTCWPEDGGRFVTLPLVLTHHPVEKKRNLGMYRMHVYDAQTTGMHWQIQKGGGFHYHEAEKRGEDLPVAVLLGTDPYLLMAAIAPLPEGLDEVMFSGFLRGSPTVMTRAKTIPVDVPAEAEFILEGVVPKKERHIEGPFGDHFGHYSLAGDYPVFHIKKITHAPNPIYPATVVGIPPQEDRYLGDAMQEVLSPLIRVIKPEIKDLWAYYEAGFHNLLVVSLKQRYQKEAMKTAMGLLGEGQLSLTKCMVLVDEDVPVRSFSAVLKEIAKNWDAHEDALLLSGVPMDTLDFTSFKMNLGSKMILDATSRGSKGVSTPPTQPSIDSIRAEYPEIKATRVWENTLLLVQVKTHTSDLLSRLIRDERLGPIKWVALVSDDIQLMDDVNAMWGLFTRFDCARDVEFSETHLIKSVPVYKGRMGIDATFKPGYPKALVMPEEVVQKVTRRWKEYGIS